MKSVILTCLQRQILFIVFIACFVSIAIAACEEPAPVRSTPHPYGSELSITRACKSYIKPSDFLESTAINREYAEQHILEEGFRKLREMKLWDSYEEWFNCIISSKSFMDCGYALAGCNDSQKIILIADIIYVTEQHFKNNSELSLRPPASTYDRWTASKMLGIT